MQINKFYIIEPDPNPDADHCEFDSMDMHEGEMQGSWSIIMWHVRIRIRLIWISQIRIDIKAYLIRKAAYTVVLD